MEVLANGMKVNFWIGVEEEPDIDRFIDEQIMIDMDRFMLVGTLEKVATCKKKNEEKEYEYFKQITVQVNNICSAEDNNINIAIPAKKEEFMYEVKFRYAPEPEQVAGDGMEPVSADEGAGEEILQEAADNIAEEANGDENFEPTEEQQAEIDHRAEEELADEADAENAGLGQGLYGKPAKEPDTAEEGKGNDDVIVVTVTPGKGKPLTEVLDTDGLDPELNLDPDDADADPEDEGIDWGDDS